MMIIFNDKVDTTFITGHTKQFTAPKGGNDEVCSRVKQADVLDDFSRAGIEVQ
jgi:hypothetical protein